MDYNIISSKNNVNCLTTTYLTAPTGQYGVGYQDIHLLNERLCPDIYYTGINKEDFSSINKNYCHEVMVRVYYPTSSTQVLKDPYYSPIINKYKADLNRLSRLITEQEFIQYTEALDAIKTFSSKNDSNYISNKSFPVIIFLPGHGVSVQMYENFISNLTSHGYVILGINSLFLSGNIELPNGHIVKTQKFPSQPDVNFFNKSKMQPAKDFEYILNNMEEILNKEMPRVASQVNFNIVGALGHSLGGTIIVNYLHQKTNKLCAASALEIGGACTDKDDNVYKLVNIPFMHQVAASRFDPKTIADLSSRYNWIEPDFSDIGNHGYVVIHRQSALDYISTQHMSFSDLSTLLYNPGIKFIAKISKLSGVIGTTNGWELTRQVNHYLACFFEIYLANKSSDSLNCQPISSDIEFHFNVEK